MARPSCAATNTGDFDFSNKFTQGRNSTFQVQRAAFDKVLADEAEKQGVEIRYETRVTAVDNSGAKPRVRAVDAKGMEYEVEGQFVLDASGFGRVLPKLLDLETPSKFPVRNAVFTHVADGAAPDAFDRNKIQVIVHPQHRDVWFWLIPFAHGRCSLGCVAAKEFFDTYPTQLDERLKKLAERRAVSHSRARECNVGYAGARAVGLRRECEGHARQRLCAAG